MSQKQENRRLRELQEEMEKQLGKEAGSRLGQEAQRQLTALLRTLNQYPSALHRHLNNNIFPAAAVFQALLQQGRSRQEAAAMTDALFGACM